MANPFSDIGISDAEFEAAINSEEINAAKVALAESCAEYWRSISPVRTGRYRNSIHVEVTDAVRVVADTPYAAAIEYGTDRVQEGAYRTQTEAAMAFKED